MGSVWMLFDSHTISSKLVGFEAENNFAIVSRLEFVQYIGYWRMWKMWAAAKARTTSIVQKRAHRIAF